MGDNFLAMDVSKRGCVKAPKSTFMISPNGLRFVNSRANAISCFAFLFPLGCVSFYVGSVLSSGLLRPLGGNRLVVDPEVGSATGRLYRRLIRVCITGGGGARSVVATRVGAGVVLLRFVLRV